MDHLYGDQNFLHGGNGFVVFGYVRFSAIANQYPMGYFVGG